MDLDEPTTIRSVPVDSLAAEHRRNSADYEDQLLGWWQHLRREVDYLGAAPARSTQANIELAVKQDQLKWLQLFLTQRPNGQTVVNPRLPITHLFLDEQCPVIALTWGPASPTCAILLLVNELPEQADQLNVQLDHLKHFVALGPPRCVGVVIYSAVSKFASIPFDRPETFLVEDPAAVLRATLSVEHTSAARRYYAGRMALPCALIAVGNGALQPRVIKEHMGKREFSRRPDAAIEIREVMSAPLSHLGPTLWHRLNNFTTVVERREIARVGALLDDYQAKQQWLARMDPRMHHDFATRTRRELNFTIGWTPEFVARLLAEGTEPIRQEFAAWREKSGEKTAAKSEDVLLLKTKRR